MALLVIFLFYCFKTNVYLLLKCLCKYVFPAVVSLTLLLAVGLVRSDDAELFQRSECLFVILV